MRDRLQQYYGQRITFTAVVIRFGKKKAYKYGYRPTLLLHNVCIPEVGEVTDHLWMTGGVWSEDVKEGDVIEFKARVNKYTKGYRGHRDVNDSPVEIDFRLVNPTQVRVIEPDSYTLSLLSGDLDE